MVERQYRARLNTTMDDAELRRRLSAFEITEEDLQRLASLRPLAERHMDGIVEEFYELLLNHEEMRVHFPDEATVRHVKRMQREYFLGLFGGVVDLQYVEDRLRAGATHERIGVPPKLYLAAYSRYLRLILDRVMRDIVDVRQACQAYASIEKLVHFDMALALDTYLAASIDTITRHQAAIRELSTPVIRVYERILLMPIIGTVDSQRAQQIMETVLVRVVEEQARVLILDIAGVSLVDSQVADHLLETTAAVRLLGAQTILTGISAQVARTIVRLGVEISSMYTCSRLADGIELALRIVGKRIAPEAPQRSE